VPLGRAATGHQRSGPLSSGNGCWGISIAPGPIFSAKQKFENFIRINCGNPWSDILENAVRKLGEIIAETG